MQPPKLRWPFPTDPSQFPESPTTDIPIRILIEDGQPDIREMVATHLTSLGYECKVAESPNHVLETLRLGERFDLVYFDLANWTEEKFSHLWERKTHVVASTAVYDAALIERLLDYKGRVDFLLKPFTLKLLTIVVQRGLERHRLLMENLFFRNWIGLGSGIEIPRMEYRDHL